MTERKVLDYLDDMIRNLELAIEFIRDKDFASFEKDFRINYAVVRALEIVGESAKRIPDTMRRNYPSIPWRAMAGMRDKLIHGYDDVNLALVWSTTKDTIPGYLEALRKIRFDLTEPKIPTKKT